MIDGFPVQSEGAGTPRLHYGDMYGEDPYSKRRVEKCAELLRPLVRPGLSILDVGCYTAELLTRLPAGVDYWGVDFDEPAIAQAVAHGATMVRRNFNVEPLALDRTFDVIACTEVLEHLTDPHGMMRQFSELLKDQGHLLISLPNENTIFHRLMSVIGLGIDASAFELYKHLHFPTIKQAEAFVARYGTIVDRAYYVNPGGKSSRLERLSGISQAIPDVAWEWLATIRPGLFARGSIFLARKRA